MIFWLHITLVVASMICSILFDTVKSFEIDTRYDILKPGWGTMDILGGSKIEIYVIFVGFTFCGSGTKTHYQDGIFLGNNQPPSAMPS